MPDRGRIMSTCKDCHFYSERGAHCFKDILTRNEEIRKVKAGLSGDCKDHSIKSGTYAIEAG